MTLKLYFIKCPERYISQSIVPLRTFVLHDGFMSLYCKKYLIKQTFSSDITNFFIELRQKIPYKHGIKIISPRWASRRFPGIAGSAGNQGSYRKFRKSHQILSQIYRNIDKLCLGKKSSKNKIFRRFRVLEYALWQKTKTWKCRKSTESFLNQKIPIVNSYHQKTAKKLPIWYQSTICGFNNQKSYLFQGSILSFVGNFEQYFESCVMITQNPLKIALNKINGPNTSKIQLIKIFRGFRVF